VYIASVCTFSKVSQVRHLLNIVSLCYICTIAIRGKPIVFGKPIETFNLAHFINKPGITEIGGIALSEINLNIITYTT